MPEQHMGEDVRQSEATRVVNKEQLGWTNQPRSPVDEYAADLWCRRSAWWHVRRSTPS